MSLPTPSSIAPPNADRRPRWFPDIATLRWPAAILAMSFIAITVASSFVVAASALQQPWGLVVGLADLMLGIIGCPVVALKASRWWGSGRVVDDVGLRFRPIDLVIGLGAAAVAFGVMMATSRVIDALAHQTSNVREFHIQFPGAVVVELIVLSGVLAPVTEELLFRGVLLRGMASRWGPTAGVIAQGVVFGVAHAKFDGVWSTVGVVVTVTAVGIVFGWVARATGRLAPGMVAHSVYNLVLLVLAVTTARWQMTAVSS